VFDQFTELARRAIVASEAAALSLGHDFIGTGHLLLGLATTAGTASEVLRQHGVELSRARDETVRQLTAAGIPATGGQPAKDALSLIGIDVSEIQRRADDTFGPGTFRFPRPAFSPRAKTALELTLREARELGHERIDTEDMLLGLLAEGEGTARHVLSALNVDPATLRQSLLDRSAADRSAADGYPIA
jgi:ATP-dependent Clp protease ATP-binding subunit ClpC